MLHSPYSQFISSLWRGSESRINVEIHASEHYAEIKNLLLNGIEIQFERTVENSNVVPVISADLCFVKEVIGKCSSTSLYGCFYCKKHISKWYSDISNKAERQTMTEILSFGEKALQVLGKNPAHDSKAFTEFQQSHYGQYVSV